MKRLKIKKTFVSTIAINFIILFAIFSVFSVCFWTDSAAVVSSTGYKAIYRGNENKKEVSLCINVYWGTEYLDEMLKTLKETGVNATFFVGGCWVAKNLEILRKIHDDGHEIANHRYYHKDHKQIDYSRNIQNIHIN